jgi:multiple sugar transport system permease protein
VNLFRLPRYLPLILPLMVYTTALLIVPTFYQVYLSFFDWTLTGGNPTYTGLKNWESVIVSPSFHYSLELTILFGILVTSVEIALGIGIAVLIKSGGTFGRIVQNFTIIPLMMTPLLVDLVWKYIYAQALGPGFYLASILGFTNPSFLEKMPNAFFSLALVDIWQWTPFVILVVLAGLYIYPSSLHESSQLDGAGSWQEFRYMILPFLKPFLGIVLLFRLIDALKTFESVAVLTGGGPVEQTQLASFFIWFNGLGNLLSVGDTSAYGLVFTAIVILIGFVIVVLFRRSWGR